MKLTNKQLEMLEKDDYKAIKKIVERDKSINKELLLLNAIERNSMKTIKMLIAVGTDYYALNEDILFAAVKSGNEKILRVILEKRYYSYNIMNKAMKLAEENSMENIYRMLYNKYYS